MTATQTRVDPVPPALKLAERCTHLRSGVELARALMRAGKHNAALEILDRTASGERIDPEVMRKAMLATPKPSTLVKLDRQTALALIGKRW